MVWDGTTWQQWNGGTCANVAAASNGTAYVTDDCQTVRRSGAYACLPRCLRGGVAALAVARLCAAVRLQCGWRWGCLGRAAPDAAQAALTSRPLCHAPHPSALPQPQAPGSPCGAPALQLTWRSAWVRALESGAGLAASSRGSGQHTAVWLLGGQHMRMHAGLRTLPPCPPSLPISDGTLYVLDGAVSPATSMRYLRDGAWAADGGIAGGCWWRVAR